MPGSIQKQVLGTYFSLRVGTGVIGAVFPFLLWLGGRLYAGLPLQDSMSAYYYAAANGRSMRDWFVGVLFAIGICLYLYKGYSQKENIALNVAGVMAVGIAVFPTQWDCGSACSKYSTHGVCAVTFFLCIAFVCIFCSGDTLGLILDLKTRAFYRRTYRILAALMLASPLIALLINEFFQEHRAPLFYVEAAGILAFSAYWLTKSKELATTQAEKRAIDGEFEFDSSVLSGVGH